ncbi:MAG TPA: ferrous iron transporter B, partial [Phycisphaerales bacterium]|nr:ferrous iron transporter B [Phycisphaerales bacterium]
ASGGASGGASGTWRFALLGNPNTGKTTLFNRLCGLRHKTANFPGTTQDARVGALHLPVVGAGVAELIDLPGVYSLELDQGEAAVCREVLAGQLAPRGESLAPPRALCVVVDALNLSRGLVMVGEALRRRLPTVVAVNMLDLARQRGVVIDAPALAGALGCAVVPCSARTGEGLEALLRALADPRIPNTTPPAGEDELARWAEGIHLRCTTASPGADEDRLTDRLDALFTHPVAGVACFGLIMGGLFWVIFSLAAHPMDWIDRLFALLGGAVAGVIPPGVIHDVIAGGVVPGIAGVLVFLPQICLLFLLISLLEDTGYLARAAFVVDRALRPFGLPGHAFVPLLSSHACALPGIMAARAIPDRRERLATILVAPFMTCSARLPVYVLVTGLLFPGSPLRAALAFIGAYALGILAGVLSALLARRTILRGRSRPMALELPSYKLPSVRTALISTWDRAVLFVRNAGTNILAISVALWWLGAYPHVSPPPEAEALRTSAAEVRPADPAAADALLSRADRLEAAHASANSFAGRLGRLAEPVFRPLGYDWQLTVGVLTSFAAREVFVSTMAVITTGMDDAEDEGVLEGIRTARRSDGTTPIFTASTSWSLLVFYVLAMQCLPTLVVTAREAGAAKWALLQFAWMSGVAYGAAWLAYSIARALGAS